MKEFIKKFYSISKNFDGQFCITEAKKNPYFNMLEIKKRKFTISKKVNKVITARQNAPKVYNMLQGYIYLKRIYFKNYKFFEWKNKWF